MQNRNHLKDLTCNWNFGCSPPNTSEGFVPIWFQGEGGCDIFECIEQCWICLCEFAITVLFLSQYSPMWIGIVQSSPKIVSLKNIYDTACSHVQMPKRSANNIWSFSKHTTTKYQTWVLHFFQSVLFWLLWCSNKMEAESKTACVLLPIIWLQQAIPWWIHCQN